MAPPHRRARHLWLRWNTARGPDLGPARNLVALRSLHLDGGGSVRIDLATFVEATGLRHLTVRACVVEHGDRIGAFGELHAFESRDAAVDLAWLAPATTLVSVRIAGATVRSLDDLAAQPRLADVVVADARMRRGPRWAARRSGARHRGVHRAVPWAHAHLAPATARHRRRPTLPGVDFSVHGTNGPSCEIGDI